MKSIWKILIVLLFFSFTQAYACIGPVTVNIGKKARNKLSAELSYGDTLIIRAHSSFEVSFAQGLFSKVKKRYEEKSQYQYIYELKLAGEDYLKKESKLSSLLTLKFKKKKISLKLRVYAPGILKC